jgi:hypothetical protein
MHALATCVLTAVSRAPRRRVLGATPFTVTAGMYAFGRATAYVHAYTETGIDRPLSDYSHLHIVSLY